MAEPEHRNVEGADREDDGEDTVFEQPSALLNELQDSNGETEDGEDEDFDPSLLEDLMPDWREVNETAIQELMADHAQLVEIALMKTMEHLHSLCTEEEVSEVE